MNLIESHPSKANSPPAERIQASRVPERWLGIVRVVWWLVVNFYIVLFMAGLFPSFEAMREICDPSNCTTSHWFVLTAQQGHTLATWGVSLDMYAAWMSFWEVLIAALMAGCGLLIFIRRSNEWIAVIASLALVVLGCFLIPAAPSALLPFLPWLTPLIYATFIWGNWLFPLLLFLLPDGRFVPRWSYWFVFPWGTYVTYVILTSGIATNPDNQEVISRLGSAILLVSAGVGVYGQIYRYRHVATPLMCNQIKWIGIGVTGFLFSGIAGAMVSPFPTYLGDTSLSTRLLVYTLTLIGFGVFPIALTFAILRYRLWDIDVVLNRALVYGGMTVAIVFLYILVVGGLSSLLHTQGNTTIVFVGACLVAILFQPLRERLQRGANRLIYGRRDEPYAVLAQFGRQLETTPALETLPAAIVSTIKETLKLSQVMIALNDQALPDLHSVVNKALIPFPLSYQGTPLGRLLVAPREGETELSQKDHHLLEDLASQIGVAVHAARVTTELQRARERLVTTREEERRRLRRDLHDGLGPTLAAIAIQSEAARDLIATHPEHSTALLNDIVTQAQTATADIRRLVYNLRPPALDDLGLLGALQAQAQRVNQPGGLQVVVEAEALPVQTAAVEVAVYRIVQEALANVVRHAEAKNCQVRLQAEGNMLLAEIQDDGRGIPLTIQPGVGLSSMRERAEELGGVFSITMNGRGTTIHARLPLQGG